MKRILFSVIVLLFVIDGCRRNTASAMVFDDIEYVRSFPETLSLSFRAHCFDFDIKMHSSPAGVLPDQGGVLVFSPCFISASR